MCASLSTEALCGVGAGGGSRESSRRVWGLGFSSYQKKKKRKEKRKISSKQSLLLTASVSQLGATPAAVCRRHVYGLEITTEGEGDR